LNWIGQYGLNVVEKDVETPMLVVPTELFYKLKKDVERFVMTEKRFRLNKPFIEELDATNYIMTPILDEGKELSVMDVVELLNELHEKKEILELQLKSANNEIDKLMAERNMLTDTYHDCCKKIRKENEQLKSDNFNLNKSVECLDETVKEQCNKIDWADECGVRWEEEYEKWKE